MTFGRVRSLIFVAVLFIAGGIVVATAIRRDSQANPVVVAECASGQVPAKTRMPDSRGDVTLNIYNGTKTAGLAESVADELKFRGFKVDKIGTAPKQSNDIADIAFGPQAIGAAYLVSANFLVDQAVMNFDIKRKDAEVDVTIGAQFEQLATTTEVNQSIAAIGNPTLPEGTCNAPGNKS